MKKSILYIITLISIISLSACKKILEVNPQGAVTNEQLNEPQNLEGLVTAAYAQLGNDHYTAPNLLWPRGDLSAGDAHKGGDGPSDIFGYHAYSVFTPIIADMSTFPPEFVDLSNKKWERQFVGISRVNSALARLNDISETDFALKKTRIAELRFLRGHYYFDLKIQYKRLPYIDETLSPDSALATSNVALTNDELWSKIANDFRFAADNLPVDQAQIGRANKINAKAYLAKVLLYQAYEQNDQHAVININKDKLEEVITLVDEVIASGKYGLFDDFGKNFLYQYENGTESVFAIQRSREDGTIDGKGSYGTALNTPDSPEFGCCGFHVPTQNLVNSFKTDTTNGLPEFDTFNNSDYNVAIDAVDPRLDHTVAMDGKPFKYDPNYIYSKNWARSPAIYGSYTSMKELESPKCACRITNGPFSIFSMNTVLIRYADVLLWKAEALIEVGRHMEALPIINQIRERAGNSTKMLNNTSIYKIGLYTAAQWTPDFARNALRWERRMELALEGSRFFDLVRWGIAKETLDQYFQVEKTKTPYLTDASFTKGKHEYLPIPQRQIVLSKGLYHQNPGY